MNSNKKPQQKSSKPAQARNLAPDELKLWKMVTENVETLNISITPPSQHPMLNKYKLLNHKDRKLTSKQHHPDFLEHGKGSSLDKKSKNRMKRGKIEFQAVLDLHGMTQEVAKRSLIAFVKNAFLSQYKEILVITGKGRVNQGRVGVLRQLVPKWLNEHPIRGWIRGFNYAAPVHGGEGALYLIIRNKR